jgi:hypothetical protein
MAFESPEDGNETGTSLTNTATASELPPASPEQTTVATRTVDLPYRVRINNQSENKQSVRVKITELRDDSPTGDSEVKDITIEPNSRVELTEPFDSSTVYQVLVKIRQGVSKIRKLYLDSALVFEIVSKNRLDVSSEQE